MSVGLEKLKKPNENLAVWFRSKKRTDTDLRFSFATRSLRGMGMFIVRSALLNHAICTVFKHLLFLNERIGRFAAGTKYGRRITRLGIRAANRFAFDHLSFFRFRNVCLVDKLVVGNMAVGRRCLNGKIPNRSPCVRSVNEKKILLVRYAWSCARNGTVVFYDALIELPATTTTCFAVHRRWFNVFRFILRWQRYTQHARARTKIMRKTKAGKKLNINNKKRREKAAADLTTPPLPLLFHPFFSDGARSYLLNPGPTEPRPPFRMQIEIRKRFRSFFRSSHPRPAGGRRGFSRARVFPLLLFLSSPPPSSSPSFLPPYSWWPLAFPCPRALISSIIPLRVRHGPRRAYKLCRKISKKKKKKNKKEWGKKTPGLPREEMKNNKVDAYRRGGKTLYLGNIYFPSRRFVWKKICTGRGKFPEDQINGDRYRPLRLRVRTGRSRTRACSMPVHTGN